MIIAKYFLILFLLTNYCYHWKLLHIPFFVLKLTWKCISSVISLIPVVLTLLLLCVKFEENRFWRTFFLIFARLCWFPETYIARRSPFFWYCCCLMSSFLYRNEHCVVTKSTITLSVYMDMILPGIPITLSSFAFHFFLHYCVGDDLR